MSNNQSGTSCQAARGLDSQPLNRLSPERRPTLWYCGSALNRGLVFAYPEQAQRIHEIRTALRANTWAEFRRLMPAEDYMDLIEAKFADIDEPTPIPADKEAFSGDWVPGYFEGDYPDWLQARMDGLLPEKILRRFGKREQTILNGPYWMIDPKHEAEIVVALEKAGYLVRKREDLTFL